LKKHFRVFHILDSWIDIPPGKKELKQLQLILLKHFEDAAFVEGRIAINVAQVPRQPNGNDCGCFMIYFAKMFLRDPEATMALIKVILYTFSSVLN